MLIQLRIIVAKLRLAIVVFCKRGLGKIKRTISNMIFHDRDGVYFVEGVENINSASEIAQQKLNESHNNVAIILQLLENKNK